MLWCCTPIAGAWEFDIHATDTEQVVRNRVINGARRYMSADGFGIEQVQRFVQAVNDGIGRAQAGVAETVTRYVSQSEPPRFLNAGEATNLILAPRLVYLSAAARDELQRVLDRVLVSYDTTRTEMTQLAMQLDVTLTETQAIQDQVLMLTTGALHHVTVAQQAADTVYEVLAEYHRIIEDQRELLSGRFDPAPSSPTLTFLAGPIWYTGDNARLADHSLITGAIVGVPAFRRLSSGFGALTTFPPTGSALVVQVGYGR